MNHIHTSMRAATLASLALIYQCSCAQVGDRIATDASPPSATPSATASASASGSASASASAPSPAPIVTGDHPLPPPTCAAIAAALRANGARINVRRYAGQSDSPEATSRVAQAFAALLKARGVQASVASDASPPAGGQGTPVDIEIDPSFYVYTKKFNAQRVRLPVYVAAQLSGPNDKGPVAAREPTADVLRVAAGALGIVTGFLSPSHGAYMITTGSRVSNTLNERTAALFGAGPAPTRLFGSDLERYARGEQEARVGVRVRSGAIERTGGTVLDERMTVLASVPGDEPPFQVDRLTTVAWQAVIDQFTWPASTPSAIR